MPAKNRTHESYDEVFDAFAAMEAASDDDLDAQASRPRRPRTRRGGPRTPLPLLPVIGICAGIGIAYVSQTAHMTQATYQAADLARQQQQLQAEAQQLDSQLAQLSSSARIDAAAQQMGMRPPAKWAYVAAVQQPVDVPPLAPVADSTGATTGDPVQRLVAALSGTFGPSEAEAAGR
ncbi:MAG TPA: cell division protein FtsL [Candidatus Dormibacteraeota bacterium]|nr:cell division protein FtsL [Candidatus Dormibacteraeota bacterium]